MNEATPEPMRGRRQTVSLSSLYLDPNNFRFADHADYRPVADEDVFGADVQRLAQTFVAGKSQEHIRDLIDSIKENGWLDIDPILVDRRESGKYLVVEGNRRVATLKYLQRQYQDGGTYLGKLDVNRFSNVPVVLFGAADERQHMVMMGLHHISGKRRWPAINRALAMKRLQKQFDGDADAVCRALGVTKQDFNRSVRTLSLVDAYKESDYGDQFKSDQYTLFREILGKPAIRSWLGWNDQALVASQRDNLDRLFNWMSEVVDTEDGDVESDDVDLRSESGPVITTPGHVRELAKLIEDPAAISRLDETRSLQEATLSSDLLVKTDIDRAFSACDDGITKLNRQVGDLDSEDLDRVDHLIGKLQGIAIARKRRPAIAMSGDRLPWEPFNELTQSRFSTVHVERYRGIDGLALEDLRPVNLISGVNNAGKTSLLEAIYLLAHQNDETALLDVNHWRRRTEKLDPVWLVKQLQASVCVSGRFDNVSNNAARLEVWRSDEPDKEIKDQHNFLTRLTLDSTYGDRRQSADVALFSDRPPRANFQGRHWLCRSALTSSFWSNRLATFVKANKAATETGGKDKVMDFIRTHVDSRVTNIELVEEQDFLVRHKDFDRAPDLSSFGDGMQRVFEIGLLFADVRGGVLLIDEFENAIHPKLLTAFTRVVQELAVEHNVQVFLTTHSKEALDAFILNDYATNDIAGYALCREENGVIVRRFDGDKLKRLHKALDFDLRGMGVKVAT